MKDTIIYFVNAVQFTTEEKHLTPGLILERAGYSLSDYYLVHKKNPGHQLPNDAHETISNGEEFLAMPLTPAPVSDISRMEEIEIFVRDLLNRETEIVNGNNSEKYLVVKDVEVPAGMLAGRHFDLALKYMTNSPLVLESAFHTRPALVPMDTSNEKRKTQSSPIGTDWQYWSRRFSSVPKNPQAVWALILNALNQAE